VYYFGTNLGASIGAGDDRGSELLRSVTSRIALPSRYTHATDTYAQKKEAVHPALLTLPSGTRTLRSSCWNEGQVSLRFSSSSAELRKRTAVRSLCFWARNTKSASMIASWVMRDASGA
jgi:hypothetical protein